MTVDTSRTIGERAFLVPILPEHVWEERAVNAPGPGGGDLAQGSTEAIVTNNIPPVGSGPFRFGNRTEGESLTFERFDDHFTRRPDVARPEPTVAGIDVGIEPNVSTAIRAVEEDAADVTSASIETNAVGGVDESGGARVLESPSWTFYLLGFNARKAPFSNPRFRRVIARLVDKEWLVEEVFDGHARPVATPVGREWVPESLEWNDMDPETPFLGSNGEVDVDAARSAFESAGFRYDDRRRLRVGQ
jgi:peptide/nickel transport system substrate-binding protein